MKKKNGFIAISLIYSFFLCFILLMMGLLANYAQSKLLLDKINEPLVFETETNPYDVISNFINDHCNNNSQCLEESFDYDEDTNTYTINSISVYLKYNNSTYTIVSYSDNNITLSSGVTLSNVKIKSGKGTDSNPFILS